MSFGVVQWTRRHSLPDVDADSDMGLPAPVSVALVDHVAVPRDGDGRRGLSVADGTAMRRVGTGRGCEAAHVAAEAGTVVL
ncbi:hypothetical protein [Embleya sp. NPDC005971]|uniref:hypothetical protein n=1 Tax=Embleya sp. NPDC005971 TaxID=3156724 RepID=UPI003401BD81